MSGHDEGKKEPILVFRDYPRGSSKKKIDKRLLDVVLVLFLLFMNLV